MFFQLACKYRNVTYVNVTYVKLEVSNREIGNNTYGRTVRTVYVLLLGIFVCKVLLVNFIYCTLQFPKADFLIICITLFTITIIRY